MAKADLVVANGAGFDDCASLVQNAARGVCPLSLPQRFVCFGRIMTTKATNTAMV